MNFSTEKEKKEIVVNSNNYLNSDNIVIFSNENANYGGLENEKNNTYNENKESNIENLTTRNNTTKYDYSNYPDIDIKEYLDYIILEHKHILNQLN